MRSKFKKHFPLILSLIAGSFISLMFLLWTHPILRDNFYHTIVNVNEFGDTYQLHYLSWALKQNLLHGRSICQDYYTFASAMQPFYTCEIGFLYWINIAVTALSNENFGFQVSFYYLPLILSFIFNFLFLAEISDKNWLSMLGATLVALLPYRIDNSLLVHQAACYQFAFAGMLWFLYLYKKKNLFTWKSQLILFSVTLFSGIFLELHITYYLFLASFGFISFVIAFNSEESLNRISLLKNYSGFIFGSICSFGYSYFLSHNVLNMNGIKLTRSLDEIRVYSKGLYNFIKIKGDTPLFPLWLYWGLICFVLYLGIRVASKLDFSKIKMMVFYLLSTILTICLAAGIKDAKFNSKIYEFAFNYLPFFNAQRVPHKMILLSATLGSAFTVLSLSNLLELIGIKVREPKQNKHTPRISHFFYYGLISCTFTVFIGQAIYFTKEYTRYQTKGDLNQVYHPELINYLKDHVSDDEIIAYLPLWNGQHPNEGSVVRHAAQSGKRFFGGYYGNPPSYFLYHLQHFNELLNGYIDPKLVTFVEENHINYFLLDYSWPWAKDFYPVLASIPGLEVVLQTPRLALFKKSEIWDLNKVDEFNSATIGFKSGWGYQSEYRGYTGHWMLTTDHDLSSELIIEVPANSKSMVIEYVPRGSNLINVEISNKVYELPGSLEAKPISIDIPFIFNEKNNPLKIRFFGSDLFRPYEESTQDLSSYGHFLTSITFH